METIASNSSFYFYTALPCHNIFLFCSVVSGPLFFQCPLFSSFSHGKESSFKSSLTVLPKQDLQGRQTFEPEL
ncbi:hypothetical protein AAG906_034712 [Vitis piasezkii]